MARKSFNSWHAAFDYCREANHPIRVIILEDGIELKAKLYPSGRADVERDAVTDIHVAVYGTLRQGEGLHGALRDSAFVGKAYLSGFKLWGKHAGFPYAVEQPDRGGAITVEVYRVRRETLNVLDGVEGYPDHYDRKLVSACGVRAWIYYVRGDARLTREPEDWIESGDWKDRAGTEWDSAHRQAKITGCLGKGDGCDLCGAVSDELGVFHGGPEGDGHKLACRPCAEVKLLPHGWDACGCGG